MKAIVYTHYGPPDVLKLKNVEKPVPKDKEILLKVHSATVTPGDCEIRAFKFPLWIWLPVRLMFGLFKPRKQIIGMDVAGEIEAVGADVENWKIGDTIFASTGMSLGAYAEYVCFSTENPIAIKSPTITYEEAATLATGGINALHYLRLGNISEGQKVLIIGAAGNFGSFGIQLAKHFGAHVTAVDCTGKLDFMRSLGADRVIDYTKENFSDGGETYDFIFDVASKSPFSDCIKSLKEEGRLVIANPRPHHMLRGKITELSSRKKVFYSYADYNQEDLVFLGNLLVNKKIRTPIDRSYPLEQAAEAHRYVDHGQKLGHVVLNITQGQVLND